MSESTQREWSRREFTRAAGIGMIGLGASCLGASSQDPPASQAAAPTTPAKPRARAVRIAHLTDMHIQPERKAGEGTAACLRHAQSLPDKPELIITGGDTVMDSFDAPHDRTKLQWELWKSVLKDNCSVPVESCVGNHDVWGWNKKKSGCAGDEPKYGKKWAAEMFGVERLYRSFDRAGWHFVLLDSVFPHGDGYIGKLDDEQLSWLETDLRAVPAARPIAIVSHIPILSAAPMVRARPNQTGDDRLLSNAEVHADCRKLIGLFTRHRNVKLCLSGHIHEVDRIDFQGVSYLCSGAVSGNWWKGKHYDCIEGYALLDLFDDGSFENRYMTYGWKAEPA